MTAKSNTDPSLEASYDITIQVSDCSLADFVDPDLVVMPSIEYNFHESLLIDANDLDTALYRESNYGI